MSPADPSRPTHPTSPPGKPLRVLAVVPTLGTCPTLVDCLRALRASGAAATAARPEGLELAIVLVHQDGGQGLLAPEARALVDRVIELPRPVGFARATNLGIGSLASDLVATVNDDAVVEPGWLGALVAVLEDRPGTAAVQGWNLRPDGRLDGRGLDFNRWLQAVQLGHDRDPEGPEESVRSEEIEEVWGVSATAALYRRSDLEATAGPSGVFDERLGSYYEDAELALRLRAAGRAAFVVPAARARHDGSATARALGLYQLRQIYGNRHLVAAEALGWAYPLFIPWLVLRDLLDLGRSVLGLRRGRVAGILSGASRALALLPEFLHPGPSRLKPWARRPGRAALRRSERRRSG